LKTDDDSASGQKNYEYHGSSTGAVTGLCYLAVGKVYDNSDRLPRRNRRDVDEWVFSMQETFYLKPHPTKETTNFTTRPMNWGMSTNKKVRSSKSRP